MRTKLIILLFKFCITRVRENARVDLITIFLQISPCLRNSWLFIGPMVSYMPLQIRMMVRMGWILPMPWKKAIEGWCKGKDFSYLHQTLSSLVSIDNITRLDRQAYSTYGALNLFLPLYHCQKRCIPLAPYKD